MPTIPDPVAEAALAHVVPDKVIAAYKRTSFLALRREVLAVWGTAITTPCPVGEDRTHPHDLEVAIPSSSTERHRTTDIGTFLTFECDMSNGSCCQNTTFDDHPTG